MPSSTAYIRFIPTRAIDGLRSSADQPGGRSFSAAAAADDARRGKLISRRAGPPPQTDAASCHLTSASSAYNRFHTRGTSLTNLGVAAHNGAAIATPKLTNALNAGPPAP